MFRIANWYESNLGRNDGNPLYVQACLKRMQHYGNIIEGHEDESLRKWLSIQNDPLAKIAALEFKEKYGDRIEVEHMAPTGDNKVFGKFDLNIHVDWGEDGLTGILPYKPDLTPKPFAYWASDTHIKAGDHDSYNYRLEVAKRADHVFVAQKAAVERMKSDGIPNPIWLPHAFEPQAYPRTEVASKRYDVCFVGHINTQNRVDALDRLFREFPNFYYGQALFDEAASKYCDSKICFNIAWSDDTNMRVHETIGTGSFLLTNRVPDIEELYDDGKHLVLYDNLDDMVEKAKYYLDHDEEREKIAQAGYEHAMKNHTIQARVMKILDDVMSKRLVSA